MTAMQRVGFVGLGGMGRGLVKNLVAKGVAVTAYDLDPAAIAVAKSHGATAAGSLGDIGDCRIIMICVNSAEDVEALLTGADGLLARAAPGLVIVDHTTGNPQMVDKLDRLVRVAGGRYAEAPMTRTPKHADIGKVNVLFGGESRLLDDLRPYFELYAENIFHIGPLGHAIRLKLIHNYIAFANVAAWCEGFALAAKDGLDLTQLIGIISAAGARSGMLDLYGQATLDGDFTPLMSLANARKDVRYYARWMEDAGLPGFMAEAVHQTYRQAALLGHDGESCTAVIKVYEAVTGVDARVRPPTEERGGGDLISPENRLPVPTPFFKPGPDP
jgi:2-hydroxy-3-oxopropionate reductase